MSKRSDLMTKGPERAPHRSLLRAEGFTDWEMERPMIGIANSFNEIIPGHMHLDKLVDAVKAGIYAAGGTPVVFNTIGVCDGIAMNHVGMKYSLPSRELIADSLEIMANSHPFDGLVLMSSCDKIIPGMLIGCNRCADGNPAVFGDFAGDKPDPAHIDIPVLLGKCQFAGKIMPHDISVQQCYRSIAELQKTCVENIGDGRFAGAGKTG